MHFKLEAHLKCVVIARHFQLYIAISRVPAQEYGIARAIVVIARTRCIKMLRQVNERLFLYFEVPRWNGTSRSNLCNAQKLADDVQAYFADEELW